VFRNHHNAALGGSGSLRPMITVNKVLPQGRGLSTVLLKRAATVVLDWDTRQKSRFDATDSQGRAIGVFLPRGTAVRGGDVLVAEDGSLVHVVAQPQAVLRITACAQHGSPFDLVRAAYHLGNRHVQIELTPAHLQIEPDHVLAEMLKKMHLDVAELLAPFEPEGGAYASHGHAHAHAETPADADGHAHAHAHAHDHGAPAAAVRDPSHDAHGHEHGHERGHAHDHARSTHDSEHDHGAAGHVHGPGCQHDH